MCKPNRHLGAVLLVLALLGLVAGFRFYLGPRLPADWAAELQRAARVGGKPDPNIDFRRVANLVVFFERHAASLTTEVRPGDPENLLHNAGPYAAETDALLSWPTPITRHFRFPDPKKLPAQPDRP